MINLIRFIPQIPKFYLHLYVYIQYHCYMRKLYILSIIVLISSSIIAAQPYRTRILADNIKTLTIGLADDALALPIVELKEDQQLEIRFDEMSHETHHYNYTVLHCNADWTPSDLNTYEYLEGYTNGYITDYERSINTHYLYTNYQLSIPNYDMHFKISGNYVLLIYEDDDKDKLIAQACFSILEPQVKVDAKIRANTDIEINGRYQQLDFDIQLQGLNLRDPTSEIKTFVRQNNRIDNEVRDVKPNYISESKLSFVNNKALIFEGGNEYHSFDVSSVYALSRNIDHIEFTDKGHEVMLMPDKIQRGNYMHEYDANGKFLINHQEAFEDVHTEADYVFVHLKLHANRPFFDGQLYVGGAFNYNKMDEAVRLHYDNQAEAYTKTLFLKQGGYNYQYWFVPKNASKATVTRVDGSYWQTENDYTIYVYHRPWGERYDRLIGVKSVISE
jgi:hypothetical protein